MSGPEGFSPFEQEIARIYDFLGDVFPYALMRPAVIDPEDELRISMAGLGIAEIYPSDDDGEPFYATYIRDHTNPVVTALSHISAAENHDLIPPGSHDQAIDALILGLPGPLDDYIPRQIV